MSAVDQGGSGPEVTDLPNEVLVRIFSYLDLNSLLGVRNSCHRFWLVTEDPICWPTSLFWNSSNRINDVDRLNSVLWLSKSTVRKISLSCLSFSYPFSACFERLQACHSLNSVAVHNVSCTKAQVEKVLCLPLLSYLHLDCTGELNANVLLETVAASSCQLCTLSFRSPHFSFQDAERWVKLKCTPPDLRIAIPEKIQMFMILSLQPSIERNAYLSVYDAAFGGGFAAAHPYLQFRFSPSPSLALVHLVDYLPLVLTTGEPSSKQFSCAIFNSNCQSLKATHKFEEISSSLTVVNLSRSSIQPGTLDVIGQSCPNLLHLDLSYCDSVPLDMNGLSVVAASCRKLRVLNLASNCSEPETHNVDRLWKVLQSMPNLQALYISIYFVGVISEPVSMPQLTNLHISGSHGFLRLDSVCTFLSQIPSLKVFKCVGLSPVMPCSNMLKCLHTSLKLTHLYLQKDTGLGQLTLPAGAVCYQHLQKFYLECSDVVVREDLTSALAQGKDLSVVVFRVRSIATKGIIELMNSLKALALFHIDVVTFERSASSASVFAKSLHDIAKNEGRIVDLKINVGLKITIGSHLEKIECSELFEWFPFV